MAVELKIGSAETDESEATKKPQDTVNLVARRSLNGDIMIFDHEDIDIVVMPDKNKIVTFPKDLMEDKVYSSQDRLFYFLRKNGVIEPESVQGGNIYGSIEAAIASPLEENVSSVQVAVRTISKFIEEEKPYFRTYQEFEEDYDEWNNQSVFDDESPNGSIFGYWDDFNPSNSNNEVGSGEVKYHSNANRLVIWYDNVIPWTDLERIYDFQIVLYKTGKIKVNYRSMQDDANSGTIGIKSPTGEYLLEVIYNSAFVSDELSVAFNTASWLSLDFISGDQYQIPYGSSSLYRINANTFILFFQSLNY